MMAEEPAPPTQLSQDRAYVWDGDAWQLAVYSPDGAFVWDGKLWRDVRKPIAPQAHETLFDLTFSFEVGDQEVHTVAVDFRYQVDQIKISVDGRTVVDTGFGWWWFRSWGTKKQFPITVGTTETHAVVIEWAKKVLSLSLHGYVAKAFVDGRLIGQTDGSKWVPAP